MLDKKKKEAIIKKYCVHAKDSGSAQVQIAILTEEIKELTGHLQTHKKDFSSRRGLLRKVGQRRKLLNFLQKDNEKSYEEIVKKLKIKKVKNAEIDDNEREEKEIEEKIKAEEKELDK
jgi:small subunit ribosomal protein S15